MRQIIERALEISLKRRGYLEAMRKAIRSSDKESVFELAKKLTGLTDEECDRVDSRFDGRAGQRRSGGYPAQRDANRLALQWPTAS